MLESREIRLSEFLSLGISNELVEKLQKIGVAIPTPIQKRAIPLVINGKDIIAQAQTGTGKTFAFVLPIIENLDPNKTNVQALIVTPTRELALQITDEVNKLIADLEGIHVLAVYGGQDVAKQLHKLKKNIQIVVGTPGRLLDHIRRSSIELKDVSSLILDEADQMLHIGFLHEVEEIINETPKSRQTLLFSATIPSEIRKLAKKHMREPEYIQVEKTQGPAITVKQIAFHTIDRAKQASLIHLLETYRPYLAVIFCRTKRRVSKLYEVLKGNGFSVDELHGDLSQAKREQVMKRFREAKIQILVATDVAARGLDVEGVTHVFNYDIPQDPESYVHRIGRTGRAGMTGLAITFYSSADRQTLEMIEKELHITIQKQKLEIKTNTKEKTTGAKNPPKEHLPTKKIKSSLHSKPNKNRSTQKTERNSTTKGKLDSNRKPNNRRNENKANHSRGRKKR